MIDIPFDEAVSKITEEAGISAEEVQQQVDEKLKQLSGLISKDGAIHIIANELGVQLQPKQQGGQEVKIKDLKLDSRNVIVTGRVVQKWDIKEFDKNGRQGKVASLLLGDETGVTRLVFWNDQVDVFEELKQDDILRVKNPFVKPSYKQDRLELQLNQQSGIEVNPQGVTVAKPEFTPKEQPERIQKYIKDLEGGEENVELVATIVQVYDPRFYDACPECRKKLVDGLCPNHGEVQAEPNFSASLFLDDGTGNIRTNFWKQQCLVLTGKSEADFLKYRDDPQAFEAVKTELLGEIIKVVGSARKNQQYDSLDFTAQLVFKDVDPAKEIENLDKKFSNDKKDVVEEDVISLEDLENMGD